MKQSHLIQCFLLLFFLFQHSIVHAQFINNITVDTGPENVGQNTSLYIVNGHPAIAYEDATNQTLYYVRAVDLNGTTWNTPVQINSSINTINPSLTVHNGKPVMSYYDITNGVLKYAQSSDVNGESWGISSIADSNGDVGTYSSLAVVSGNPAMSYYDITNGDLKYIRSGDAGGFNWTPPASTVVSIDQTGNVGEHTSLHVVNGHPSISYYDVTNGNLKYVRASNPEGSVWDTPITIDQTGDVGTFNSLKIINGKPAISYYDATYGQLKYTSASDVNGTTWNTPQVIDTNGNVGQHTSLAIIDNKPAISYSDVSTGNLKFIQADDANGSSWTTTSIIAAANGQYTSLAVVNNEVAIAYYDYNKQVLKYIRDDSEIVEDNLGGEYYEKQMIVELGDLSEQERIDLRMDVGATLIDTCLCGTLELWRVPETIMIDGLPITEINEKEEKLRMKAKVEEAGRNYLMDISTFTAKPFESPSFFRTNNLNLQKLVRVGLVDSGMDYHLLNDYLDERPDTFDDCLNDPLGYDFPNDNSNPLDYLGHGTAMVGRIVNAYRGGLIDDINEFDSSVADSIKITNSKAFSQKSGNLFNMICSFKHLCLKGVDIVNCSAGYTGEKSLIFEKTIRELKDKCMLLVASAGNDSLNVDNTPHYPSGFDFDNIIAVAATNGFHSGLSSYSNYGNTSVDLGYPGTIGALKPGGGIDFTFGSSQAAAGVTSIAAILTSQFPEASYIDIRNVIFETVTPISGLPVSTEGIANFTDAHDALAAIEMGNFTPCVCLPAVSCSDITVSLDASQSIHLNARDFDNGSYSNCMEGDVFFSFNTSVDDSTRIFNCNDRGTKQIQIWITDASGQQDFCTAELTVEDDGTNNCPPCPPSLHLSGVLSSGLYQAAQTITINATLEDNSSVTLIAGESITLEGGFTVNAGSDFLAMIGSCQNITTDEVEDRTTAEKDISKIDLTVYPNPFQNNATIQYSLLEDTIIDLYVTDFSGKVIERLVFQKNKGTGEHEIALDGRKFTSGIYFLVLKTSKEIQTQKLMILGNN